MKNIGSDLIVLKKLKINIRKPNYDVEGTERVNVKELKEDNHVNLIQFIQDQLQRATEKMFDSDDYTNI